VEIELVVGGLVGGDRISCWRLVWWRSESVVGSSMQFAWIGHSKRLRCVVLTRSGKLLVYVTEVAVLH
jgi:hypothetical protein